MDLKNVIGLVWLWGVVSFTAGCHHRGGPPPPPPKSGAMQSASPLPINHRVALKPATRFVRVKKLADGLRLEDVFLGHGAPVRQGEQVVVTYTGWLANGKIFDASRWHGGQPFIFVDGAGQVIKGWDQGVVGMRTGGIRQLVIPPSLAYGRGGSPPAIPPDATLTFRIHLLAVMPADRGP